MYELKGEELVNPPWNHDNLHEWLYRPVKVRGRSIHSKEMWFDVDRLGFKGVAIFLPLVTKEDEEFSYESREGLLLGTGWMPNNFRHVTNRGRWENTQDYIEHVGIVTTNEELYNPWSTQGNVYGEQYYSIRKCS